MNMSALINMMDKLWYVIIIGYTWNEKMYWMLYRERFAELEDEDLKKIEDYDSLDSKEIKKVNVMYSYNFRILGAEQ